MAALVCLLQILWTLMGTVRGQHVSAVALDVKGRVPRYSSGHQRLGRATGGVVQAELRNAASSYIVNVTLGTPPQQFQVTLDTGSSDLWVNTPASCLSSANIQACHAFGTYSPNSSSTYTYLNSLFQIKYAGGSSASGSYVKDTMSIDQTTVKDLEFGVAYTSSLAHGILGVGYPSNEAVVAVTGQPYPNLPQILVRSGAIKAHAFSLWLNDLESNTGSILFGGIDTEKFLGQLSTVPILPVGGRYSAFVVAMTGLSVDTVSSKNIVMPSSQPIAVLLDSGTTLTYLPPQIIQAVYQNFGVTFDQSQGLGFVPCSVGQQKAHLTYNFSSILIKVSMDELVMAWHGLTFRDGTHACVFGLAPASSGSYVLGDTFLRSAYVVFDLDHNEVSLAQTNFNATSSHIIEIGTGVSALPSATKVTNPATGVVVSTPSAVITPDRPSSSMSTVPGSGAVSTPSAVITPDRPSSSTSTVPGSGAAHVWGRQPTHLLHILTLCGILFTL